MTTPEENKSKEEAVTTVPIDLSTPPLTDKELSEEMDKFLSEHPKDTPFNTLMGEARRRFLYRADMDKVASVLKKKQMCQKVFGCGTSSLFF